MMIQQEKLLKEHVFIRDEPAFICKFVQEKKIKQYNKAICLSGVQMLNEIHNFKIVIVRKSKMGHLMKM